MTEAQRIYQAIFGRPIPSRLETQFKSVPDHVLPPIHADARSHYDRIIREVGDLEALEYASRVRGRNKLLVLKFRLLVYLAECHPENRDDFVNRDDRSLLYCVWLFGRQGLRTAWKLLKGFYLLRHYDGS